MTDSVPDQTPTPAPTPVPVPVPAPSRGVSPVAWLVSLALAAVVGAVLFIGGYLAGGGGGDGSCSAPTAAFESFCDAYERLKADYVDDLDDFKLAEGAIQGMFQFGVEDPFSGYMPREDYQTALGDLSGKFSGIGAEMSIKNIEDPADLAACTELSDTCVFVVVAPLAGSPAEEAGLLAGDIVTHVDGVSVEGSTTTDQIDRIRGEAGTEVTLTIRRERENRTFDLTITRAEITMREVTSRMIDGHVGYIELNGFSDAASAQFREGLSELLEQGADQIVFDLRDNPGGYIDAAQQIASQFIDEGVIFTQESSGDDERTWESTGDGVATDPDLPVVVLVNGGSASASEIVAGALSDTGRATLVGEPTYGKNTVQIWAELPNEGGVRITISRWFTPDHTSVAPNGIQPDIVAARAVDTPPDEDVALERALAFLAEGTTAGEGAPADASSSPSASPAAAIAPSPVVGVVWLHRFC